MVITYMIEVSVYVPLWSYFDIIAVVPIWADKNMLSAWQEEFTICIWIKRIQRNPISENFLRGAMIHNYEE